MRRFLLVFMLTAMLGLACGTAAGVTPSAPAPSPTPAAPGTPPPVPPEYQSLADELDAELTSFEVMLDQQPAAGPERSMVGTELAFANGNVAEGLLQSGIPELNGLLLDRLQELGVQAVMISIPFPLLDPSYPRSDEYLEFYKDIMDRCRRLGLKTVVESGAMFSGTDFSSAVVDWSAYTTSSYLQGRENQLLLMARELRPDYLLIANEPSTEEMLTGLTIGPAEWGAFLRDTAGAVDRSGGLAVGAGIGNWEDNSYFTQVIQIPDLDFFDLHVYPMGEDATLLDRGLKFLRDARTAGKRLTITESWLFKVDPRGGGSAYGDYAGAIGRDVYSFWEPLDARFIEDLVRMSDTAGVEFVSFFWTRYFFAYLDYDSTPRGLSVAELMQRINRAGVAGVRQGTYSALGEWFGDFLQIRRAEKRFAMVSPVHYLGGRI